MKTELMVLTGSGQHEFVCLSVCLACLPPAQVVKAEEEMFNDFYGEKFGIDVFN